MNKPDLVKVMQKDLHLVRRLLDMHTECRSGAQKDALANTVAVFVQTVVNTMVRYQICCSGCESPEYRLIEDLIKYAKEQRIEMILPEEIVPCIDLLDSVETGTFIDGDGFAMIQDLIPVLEDYVQKLER